MGPVGLHPSVPAEGAGGKDSIWRVLTAGAKVEKALSIWTATEIGGWGSSPGVLLGGRAVGGDGSNPAGFSLDGWGGKWQNEARTPSRCRHPAIEGSEAESVITQNPAG